MTETAETPTAPDVVLNVEFPEALLSRAEVERMLSVSKTGLNALRASDPTFPQPVKLAAEGRGNRKLRWKQTELVDWIGGLATSEAHD